MIPTSNKTDHDDFEGRQSLPLEVGFSEMDFALFGNAGKKNTLYIKSKRASIELLGSYPIEEKAASGDASARRLSNVFGLFGAPYNWVTSSPIVRTTESMASGSLVLLWKGFSTNEDKRKVKNSWIKVLMTSAQRPCAVIFGAPL